MGSKGERELDDAERWLRDNDPNYAQRSREWKAPRTDALERMVDKRGTHDTFQDLKKLPEDEPLIIGGKHGTPAVIGDGNYRKKRVGRDDSFRPTLDDLMDDSQA